MLVLSRKFKTVRTQSFSPSLKLQSIHNASSDSCAISERSTKLPEQACLRHDDMTPLHIVHSFPPFAGKNMSSGARFPVTPTGETKTILNQMQVSGVRLIRSDSNTPATASAANPVV